MSSVRMLVAAFVLCQAVGTLGAEPSDEVRVALSPTMVGSSSPRADFSGLVDEQQLAVASPSAAPQRGWDIPSQHWKDFPYSATLDLGRVRNLSSLWLFDTNGIGQIVVSSGEPGKWDVVAKFATDKYLNWASYPLDVSTRHLRIEFLDPGANVGEVALFEHTPAGYQAMLKRTEEAARERAEREAAEQAARESQQRQPWVELPPFGRVRLVDEVDCAATPPSHAFRESPAGVSRVENVLGRACRVVPPVADQSSHISYRIGKWKLLRPGGAYVLVVDYPEDVPRSMVVMNGGNETSRGFFTGSACGDALHPKYVNNNPESIRLPLSGDYRTWVEFFQLHDRFPDLEFLRGAKPRTLAPEQGFDVTIAQFSAPNDPLSGGIAVARIKLYEVAEVRAAHLPLRLPPEPLPHRRIFWREEMSDGVIDGNQEVERGVRNRLDWYRFKANQMRVLGVNTYSKDLLEFGACQHWDSTPHGGNAWVHFAYDSRELWSQIVTLMGGEGFDVLPYYEYAGSKGDKGLGYQRRCRPLTRDDAYTHISWVETANADITDPDTYRDFKKMLDLTIVQWKDKASFAGLWMRPRWQLPMSFSEATLQRFAREQRSGKAVSRDELRRDSPLLRSYEAWWYDKRRAFLVAMRDYLRQHGINEAVVLFTAEGGESGTSFPTWERRVVTDDLATWRRLAESPAHIRDQKRLVPIDESAILSQHLFLDALRAAPLNWGDWEVHHANPPADPERYRETDGVMMTHCVHRRYSVLSSETFDAFRCASGLAIVRHQALNEDMMFNSADQPKLGYFVADFERAGPCCMMLEALAVANGDPTMIGYLVGNNYVRGFPEYVRNFNAAYLSLPALPSVVVADACRDRHIVVRRIETPAHGAYYAIVNTSCEFKANLSIGIAGSGELEDAATGEKITRRNAGVELSLYPYQLRAMHCR